MNPTNVHQIRNPLLLWPVPALLLGGGDKRRHAFLVKIEEKLDALPLTPNGKLDRKSIGNIDFGSAASDSKKGHVALQVDSKLALVIAEIENALGIQIDDPDKSFVDLGGDSLSFIRVSMVIEDAIGWCNSHSLEEDL